jgi:hypothetical protein
MKVTIHLDDAAKFTAGLVREGVTFEAVQHGDTVIFTLTGGF